MEINGAARRRWLGAAWKTAPVLFSLVVLAGTTAAGIRVVSARSTPAPAPAPTVTFTPEPTPEPVVTPSPAPAPVAAVGDAEILEAEQRLAAQGYWVGPVDGRMDPASRQALVAFQKVHGFERSGVLDAQMLGYIRLGQRPAPRIGGYRHIEIDLARQILFVVEPGGSVSLILPVSSGSGKNFTSEGYTRRAITPRGRFTVGRKIPGWRTSPLGKLYYPSYFVGGVAVHGAPSVPAYPASHGCVRIPMFAAQTMFDLMPIGTAVIVHDGGPMVQETDVASPPGLDSPDASRPSGPATAEATPAPTPTPTPTPEPSAPA